ncbi:hypothetical protein [Hyalangium rubrum]|uniref:Uncharacterized protein n=1 Tax=Hyalangium rubrum TaxID=3103134 RepID=A0ABU5HG06_9BACT|nr:hypothetical protein [Hyalangium sp. s54d21]MDY7231779.1 hypothetical protein [Hyalangium sp. s54d21]
MKTSNTVLFLSNPLLFTLTPFLSHRLRAHGWSAAQWALAEFAEE